jgi:type I restriction enzyme, R subunit
MFNEANTVEAYLLDLLSGGKPSRSTGRAKDVGASFPGLSPNRQKLGWQYLPPQQIPRQPQEVFVESFVREALIRLNPEIAANPDLAEEVLYRLRAIVLSVRSDGLIKATPPSASLTLRTQPIINGSLPTNTAFAQAPSPDAPT